MWKPFTRDFIIIFVWQQSCYTNRFTSNGPISCKVFKPPNKICCYFSTVVAKEI